MSDTVFFTPADTRALVIPGLPADSTYNVSVKAYRRVDADIDSSGVITSPSANYNPYQPSANVAFSGDILGTIQGRPSLTVVVNLENIASDNVLSTTEKPGLKIEYNRVSDELTRLVAKANEIGDFVTERDAALAAKTTLDNYLNGLTPDWDDSAQHTPIVRNDFDSNWAGFYSALNELSTVIQGAQGEDGADGASSLGAVVNGGFETGQYDPWTGDGFVSTDNPHSGTYHGVIAAGAGGPNAFTKRFAVSEGQRIFASGFLARSETQIPTNSARLAIRYYDESNTLISTAGIGAAANETVSGYQAVSGTVVAPANAVEAVLDVGESSGTGEWFFDDISAVLRGEDGLPGEDGIDGGLIQTEVYGTAETISREANTFWRSTGGYNAATPTTLRSVDTGNAAYASFAYDFTASGSSQTYAGFLDVDNLSATGDRDDFLAYWFINGNGNDVRFLYRNESGSFVGGGNITGLSGTTGRLGIIYTGGEYIGTLDGVEQFREFVPSVNQGKSVAFGAQFNFPNLTGAPDKGSVYDARYMVGSGSDLWGNLTGDGLPANDATGDQPLEITGTGIRVVGNDVYWPLNSNESAAQVTTAAIGGSDGDRLGGGCEVSTTVNSFGASRVYLGLWLADDDMSDINTFAAAFRLINNDTWQYKNSQTTQSYTTISAGTATAGDRLRIYYTGISYLYYVNDVWVGTLMALEANRSVPHRGFVTVRFGPSGNTVPKFSSFRITPANDFSFEGLGDLGQGSDAYETATGISAGFAGQGNLATQDDVDWNNDITSLPANLDSLVGTEAILNGLIGFDFGAVGGVGDFRYRYNSSDPYTTITLPSEVQNTDQDWNDISGTGLPEDNATAGADWDSNVTNLPANLNGLTGSEYILNEDFDFTFDEAGGLGRLNWNPGSGVQNVPMPAVVQNVNQEWYDVGGIPQGNVRNNIMRTEVMTGFTESDFSLLDENGDTIWQQLGDGASSFSSELISDGPGGGTSGTVFKWTVTTDQTGTGTWCGGYNYFLRESNGTLDHRKTYRFAQWIRLSDIDDPFYMGYSNYTGSDKVRPVGNNGTNPTSNNPYAFGNSRPFQADKWYLMVTYLHGSGYTGDGTGRSGFYDPNTGTRWWRGNEPTEWQMVDGITGIFLRTAMYRNGLGNTYEVFKPRIDEVNGSEPSITSLLGEPRPDLYNNRGSLPEVVRSLLPNSNLTNLMDTSDGRAVPAGIVGVESYAGPSFGHRPYSSSGGLRIGNPSDGTIAVGFPAIPIDDRKDYVLTIRHRSNAANATGLYIRMNELNTEILPNGKTHIGVSSGAPEVQNRSSLTDLTRQSTGLVQSNGPMPGPTSIEENFLYTPTPGTKLASLSFYNWASATIMYDVEWVLFREVQTAERDATVGADWGSNLLGRPDDAAFQRALAVGTMNFGGGGNIRFTKNQNSDGSSNPGEIRIQGNRFLHPDGVNRTITATVVPTPYEGGGGPRGTFYLIYTDVDATTRFSGFNTGAPNFFPAVYNEITGQWSAVDNINTQFPFTPLDSDCIVAVGTRTNTSTEINTIASLLSSDENIYEPGATLGADWGSNIAGQPADRDVLTDYDSFRVVSRGASSTSHPIGAGLYDSSGTLIGPAGRSYHLSVWDRASRSWDSHTKYDVYGNNANATAMANALNALDGTKIVVIYTDDEPQQNRTFGGLNHAIYRCGGSLAIFGSNAYFRRRSAYILIGIPGIGPTNGAEFNTGDVNDDPDAWVETTVRFGPTGFVVGGGSQSRRVEFLEDEADVTKRITGPNAVNFDFDFEGTLLAGQTGPRALVEIVTSGGTTISSGVSWTVSVSSGSWLGSVPTISGSGSGQVSFPSGPSTAGRITVTGTLDGRAYTTDIDITKTQEAAPTGGSGGGGGGGGSTITTGNVIGPITTSYTTIYTGTVFTASGSNSVVLTTGGHDLLPNEFPTPTSSKTGNVQYQWQRESSPGSGSWSNVGSVANSSPDPGYIDEGFIFPSLGAITCNRTDTGRAGSTEYSYRLRARINSGTLTNATPTFNTGVSLNGE